MLLRRDRRALFGAILGCAVLAVIVVGPLLVTIDPTRMDVRERFGGPSVRHLLGTDELGRDVLSRIVHGGFASLRIAIGAVAIAAVIGHVVGVAAGYASGLFDLVFMRITDLFFAIPGLLTTIGIVALLGAGETTTMIAIGLGFAPFYARVVRGLVVSARSQPYVDASRLMGSSPVRVIWFDILPAILPLIVAHTTAELGYAILAEAGLGFLGLGVQPPAPSWGSMLADSRQFLYDSPALGLFAGAAVVISVFAINLLGDALGDALDPRATQRS